MGIVDEANKIVQKTDRKRKIFWFCLGLFLVVIIVLQFWNVYRSGEPERQIKAVVDYATSESSGINTPGQHKQLVDTLAGQSVDAFCEINNIGFGYVDSIYTADDHYYIQTFDKGEFVSLYDSREGGWNDKAPKLLLTAAKSILKTYSKKVSK